MYLSKIEISHFRNLKALAVVLTPGLNVIVGENNVGKTNLLDALRLALGFSSSTGDPVRIVKEDFYRERDGSTPSETINISLIFSGLSSKDLAEFVEILNYDPQDAAKSTASIHYECTWSERLDRPNIRRWGGGRSKSDTSVPEEILQSLQVTLLTALRDAVSALAPGRNNRLGRLLMAAAKGTDDQDVERIFFTANQSLKETRLVRDVEEQLGRALKGTAGPTLSQKALICASEPEFEQIVRNLRLALRVGEANGGAAIVQELRNNGLGYNNLLYVATVLAELEISKDATLPFLLVEEPEAHLHPQLQVLLSDFLEHKTGLAIEAQKVQTLVTTHSPTIASHVSISSVRVLHQSTGGITQCASLNDCNFEPTEVGKLRRMFDVTRATLLFSRGVILVEGVTESLLIPILASRLGHSLRDLSISVIPVCGVDFSTIAKLFGPKGIKIPVSIITDGDPEVIYSEGRQEGTWKTEIPSGHADQNFVPCDRVEALKTAVSGNQNIKVLNSKVTLEYDLANEAEMNTAIMCSVWESLFTNRPTFLNSDVLGQCASHREKALTIWRAICRSNSSRGKGDFAQGLAERLLEKEAGAFRVPLDGFSVPGYIREAIEHILPPQQTAAGQPTPARVPAPTGIM